VLSIQSKLDLADFIAGSVLPNTQLAYTKEWVEWSKHLKEEANISDPYLQGLHEDEKASLVSLMMLRRHKQNRRGKAATAFTAAIRLEFAKRRLSTTFLDSAVVSTARSSCKMTPAELREKRYSEPTHTVKLPISEDILTGMRSRLWDNLSWSDEDKEKRMTYLGCMWGFEIGARVGEYTRAEPGKPDHCIRLDDLTFIVEGATVTQTLSGSSLAGTGAANSVAVLRQISECRVLGTSSKGKVPVKPKLIARRSPEEAQFLEDLSSYVARSGATGRDEVFSFRKEDGTEVPLRGRTVREELKRTCESNGLPAAYFSSHSLRKGAITHMRAAGATEEDRRDRGNYSAGSQVMNQTYDYAVGLGPLASNSLPGARRLGLRDVKRLIPEKRNSM
jgi:hypothetical protein